MAYGAQPASLGTLNSADGSSTVTIFGFTVTGSVNGPIEVQRRDELPEEAAIEVNIRPASGVHSPREAHLEALVHSTLRSVILVDRFPRTLIQVTLQVLAEPQEGRPWKYLVKSAAGDLLLLPTLLQAALMAVIDANVPLDTIYTTALVAAMPKPTVPESASLEDIEELRDELVDVTCLSPAVGYDLSRAVSLHVFSFTRDEKLVFNESEGSFGFQTWESAFVSASKACRVDSIQEDSMQVDGEPTSTQDWLKKAVVEKVMKDNRWRTTS